MPNAIDMFREQREAANQVHKRLTEVSVLLAQLDRQVEALTTNQDLRAVLRQEHTWLEEAHRTVAEVRAFREQELAPERAWRVRQEIRHARRIVELWNKRAQPACRPSFFPTIRTVLAAEMPILDVMCAGCQTVGSRSVRSR